jgi:hypothetical protein
MRFDRPSDPFPISAELAVERGNRLINWPARVLMAAGFALGWILLDRDNRSGLLIAAAGFVGAWLWWSYLSHSGVTGLVRAARIRKTFRHLA